MSLSERKIQLLKSVTNKVLPESSGNHVLFRQRTLVPDYELKIGKFNTQMFDQNAIVNYDPAKMMNEIVEEITVQDLLDYISWMHQQEEFRKEETHKYYDNWMQKTSFSDFANREKPIKEKPPVPQKEERADINSFDLLDLKE